jgi:hypothetical protein
MAGAERTYESNAGARSSLEPDDYQGTSVDALIVPPAVTFSVPVNVQSTLLTCAS